MKMSYSRVNSESALSSWRNEMHDDTWNLTENVSTLRIVDAPYSWAHLNTFLVFLKSREISPIRCTLRTPWNEASERTKRQHVHKARQAVPAVLSERAPEQPGQLWYALSKSQVTQLMLRVSRCWEWFWNYRWNTLATCYKNADQWDTRRQMLSIMADKANFAQIKEWIPGLTRYAPLFCEGEYAVRRSDWARKFLPRKFRDSQTDWLAKTWNFLAHNCSHQERRRPKPPDDDVRLCVQEFNQDSCAVLSIMSDVLRQLKEAQPQMNNIYYLQDNAGCYHCGTTIVGAGPVSQQVSVKRMDFCDSQASKWTCRIAKLLPSSPIWRLFLLQGTILKERGNERCHPFIGRITIGKRYRFRRPGRSQPSCWKVSALFQAKSILTKGWLYGEPIQLVLWNRENLNTLQIRMLLFWRLSREGIAI